MKGFVPISLTDSPALAGSLPVVSIDSPSMKAAAACSAFNLATGGTTVFLLVMKRIIIPSSSESGGMFRLSLHCFPKSARCMMPLPFPVSVWSPKDTFPR